MSTSKNRQYYQISANYRRGEVVGTIDRVCQLALQGKAIYVLKYNKILPAAFLQNYPAVRLFDLMLSDQLYEIVKQ